MGRINLTSLRVRQRAIRKAAASERNSKSAEQPIWAKVLRDIPPAQILTRQQPQQHPITQVRTRRLESGKLEQYVQTETPRRLGQKDRRLFAPREIKYEEDELRRTFFSDHPWELARPRIVLETDGNQYKDVDWSRGIKQPGVPVSGESVVQRQLWLLQNTPDLTVPQAYDIARTEFYMLRRAEATRRRIAIEEAEHVGARWEKTALQWGMEIENQMYNDWEKYAREEVIAQSQRSSAFSGEIMPAEQDALRETEENSESNRQFSGSPVNSSATRSSDPFVAEAQRRDRFRFAAGESHANSA